MSGKTLVPSKDALRVLRTLVNSPPVAVVGITSSVCGIVTIHCHERRKLRRAEKILENKRKLHSITKGRGSARLASMFDAAERGEDFTINRGRGTRIVKRNQHSLPAAQDESDDSTNWTPFTRQSEHRHTESSNNLESDNANWTPFPLQSKEDARARASDYVKAANTMRTDIPVYSKTARIPFDPSTNLQGYSWHWIAQECLTKGHQMQPRVTKEPRVIKDLVKHSYWRLRGLFNKTVVEQPLTDLNPLLKVPQDMFDHKVLEEEAATAGPDSILLKIDPTTLFLDNALSSLLPWNRRVVAQDATGGGLVESELLSEGPKHPDLYIDLSSHGPLPEIEHGFRSRYDLSDDMVKEKMSLIGVDRYLYVFTSLMSYRKQNGKKQALSLLEQTMNRYTETNVRSDWALVETLFLDCVRHFSTSEMKSLVWRFVEKFLQADVPRLEVVSLLYPQCGAEKPIVRQHYYYLAHRYLESIAANGHSCELQVDQLRKVLAGTRMLGIEAHEHLMIPALRSYCSVGRMASAQALFDEMTSLHKIHATFYSLRVLVKGYAQNGNWTEVESILDDCYGKGWAVLQPYGMSGLLHSVLSDYSASQPPETVVEFVVRCVKEYHIQPVSQITREIISLCLRRRRYDLAVSWVEMIRTSFPHIDTSFHSSTFAFEISCVWKEIDASCEDILESCRALATHTLRDPFSRAFRSAISVAVSQYMSPRLQMLSTELGLDITQSLQGGICRFHTVLQQLRDSAPTKIWEPRAKLLYADLIRQCETLHWLNDLCCGHTAFQDVDFSRWSRFQDPVENKTQQVRLPSASQLQDILMQGYTQRDKIGQPVIHDELREIVSQLTQQGRVPDAYNMVQMIYESRWAQPPYGKEFEIDLFTQWLKLAWDLRSGAKVRYVLWAIVDAGPQLELNSQIVLLARIAAPQTHFQRTKVAKAKQIYEVEYLRYRLRRRHSLTRSEPLKIADWEGFGSTDP